MKDFSPNTIYLVFGHDEELGGVNGAKAAVDYLKNNDVQVLLVIDECGLVLVKAINGIEQSIGLVAVGEKGYLDFELFTQV